MGSTVEPAGPFGFPMVSSLERVGNFMLASPLAFLGGTGPEGKGLAMRLALAGEAVIIGSRDAERARAAAEQLVAAGDGVRDKIRIRGAASREAGEGTRVKAGPRSLFPSSLSIKVNSKS